MSCRYWGLNDRFRCVHRSQNSQCSKWTGQPLKLPIPVRRSRTQLIHGSRGPPESTLQSASRSVWPFFAGLMNMNTTNAQTALSVCSNRRHLAIAAMRPNNTFPGFPALAVKYFSCNRSSWGGATGRALDLRSTGRGFKSYSGQKPRNNLVHTYVPLSPSSITWSGQRAVMLCGWEGNRRPGGI